MASYITYTNQNATRNRPLDEDLIKRLKYLEDMGITAQVFSGGQPGIGEEGARTGSTRHDHGNAADVFFYKDGRKLDWANADDLPIFEQIVSQGKANGVTGFGAGPGYMQEGSMHIGMGNPGVWGAGGKSDNAPAWLKAAYGGTKIDPVAEVVAAGPASTSPASDNPLFNLIQGKAAEAPKPEEPKSNNGVLVDAYNKLTGSNIEMSSKLPDDIPIFGGADIGKLTKGLSAFSTASAENDANINKSINAAAARAQSGRNSQPVELQFVDFAADRRRRKALGGLGGLGGIRLG